MARWVLLVNDDVVWYGDTSDRYQVKELTTFMRDVMDNALPSTPPGTEPFDPRDWRHLVRASVVLTTEFFGTPTIDTIDFTIDQLLPEPQDQPEDAVN